MAREVYTEGMVITLTEDEKARLRRLASTAGVPMRSVVRQLIRSAPLPTEQNMKTASADQRGA